MAGYKALFVGEQKIVKTYWKSREDAAKRIIRDGLSVVAVYETEDGKNYYDRSKEIAIELVRNPNQVLPPNVLAFVKHHVPGALVD